MATFSSLRLLRCDSVPRLFLFLDTCRVAWRGRTAVSRTGGGCCPSRLLLYRLKIAPPRRPSTQPIHVVCSPRGLLPRLVLTRHVASGRAAGGAWHLGSGQLGPEPPLGIASAALVRREPQLETLFRARVWERLRKTPDCVWHRCVILSA